MGALTLAKSSGRIGLVNLSRPARIVVVSFVVISFLFFTDKFIHSAVGACTSSFNSNDVRIAYMTGNFQIKTAKIGLQFDSCKNWNVQWEKSVKKQYNFVKFADGNVLLQYEDISGQPVTVYVYIHP